MTTSQTLYRGTLVRQPLDRVPPSDNVHQWHTRDFPYPSAEFPVARCDDEAPVGSDALNEAVVRVGAGMGTREAFKARIARNSAHRCGRRVCLSEPMYERGKRTG